jgi:hypothetical protein
MDLFTFEANKSNFEIFLNIRANGLKLSLEIQHFSKNSRDSRHIDFN